MDTNKVKNIVILLLVALNVVLFGLLQVEAGRFRLSAAQEEAIRSLFAANNFEITASVPRNFRPMRGLYVLPFHHDANALAATFFPNETPEKEVTWQGWIMSLDDGRRRLALLDDGSLEYNNQFGRANERFDELGFRDESARRRLADSFAREITPPGLNFAFSYEVVWDDVSYVIYYRGYYRGHVLHSNSIRITIRESGIERAVMRTAAVPHGFSGHERAIFSADEALFAVLRDQLIPRFSDPALSVAVTSIESAYYLPVVPADDDFFTKAIPCYKIIVNVDGFIEVYWVDAYTARVFR